MIIALQVQDNEQDADRVSGQKVFIETHGCQMNVSDSEVRIGTDKC